MAALLSRMMTAGKQEASQIVVFTVFHHSLAEMESVLSTEFHCGLFWIDCVVDITAQGVPACVTQDLYCTT